MDKKEITCERQYEILRILINGHLHLQIKLQIIIGLQSWIHGKKEFYIEYYFEGGAKITTAYGDRKTWETILKLIAENQ